MVERPPKLTVVECIVGDETASIVFSAKNEQGEERKGMDHIQQQLTLQPPSRHQGPTRMHRSSCS